LWNEEKAAFVFATWKHILLWRWDSISTKHKHPDTSVPFIMTGIEDLVIEAKMTPLDVTAKEANEEVVETPRKVRDDASMLSTCQLESQLDHLETLLAQAETQVANSRQLGGGGGGDLCITINPAESGGLGSLLDVDVSTPTNILGITTTDNILDLLGFSDVIRARKQVSVPLATFLEEKKEDHIDVEPHGGSNLKTNLDSESSDPATFFDFVQEELTDILIEAPKQTIPLFSELQDEPVDRIESSQVAVFKTLPGNVGLRDVTAMGSELVEEAIIEPSQKEPSRIGKESAETEQARTEVQAPEHDKSNTEQTVVDEARSEQEEDEKSNLMLNDAHAEIQGHGNGNKNEDLTAMDTARPAEDQDDESRHLEIECQVQGGEEPVVPDEPLAVAERKEGRSNQAEFNLPENDKNKEDQAALNEACPEDEKEESQCLVKREAEDVVSGVPILLTEAADGIPNANTATEDYGTLGSMLSLEALGVEVPYKAFAEPTTETIQVGEVNSNNPVAVANEEEKALVQDEAFAYAGGGSVPAPETVSEHEVARSASDSFLLHSGRLFIELKNDVTKLRNDHFRVQASNKRLSQANATAGASFESLNKHAQFLQVKLELSQNEAKEVNAALNESKTTVAELRDELAMKKASYVAEVQSRLAYQKTLQEVADLVQSECKDLDVVEKILALIDRTDSEAMVVPAMKATEDSSTEQSTTEDFNSVAECTSSTSADTLSVKKTAATGQEQWGYMSYIKACVWST
jgi:hypothetical protein